MTKSLLQISVQDDGTVTAKVGENDTRVLGKGLAVLEAVDAVKPEILQAEYVRQISNEIGHQEIHHDDTGLKHDNTDKPVLGQYTAKEREELVPPGHRL